MSKPPISRVFNLAFRLAVITSLVILSFLPAPFLDELGLDSGVTVANAIPIISATKVDQLVVDNDGDGQADPGDTIRYTVVITNSGSTSAGATAFNDTIDANTTLVAGTIETTPIARHDSYASIGNVGITVPAASGVLINDNDPDGGSVTAVAAAGGTANGGAFAIGADGAFSYLPPVGFEGTDSFTYKANDGADDSNVATVTITVNPANDAPTFAVGDGIVTTAIGAGADAGTDTDTEEVPPPTAEPTSSNPPTPIPTDPPAAGEAVAPGRTTGEIDRVVREVIEGAGATEAIRSPATSTSPRPPL